eukprot:scaffold40845_cov32-Tisochrysis_lutea.AAC.1
MGVASRHPPQHVRHALAQRKGSVAPWLLSPRTTALYTRIVERGRRRRVVALPGVPAREDAEESAPFEIHALDRRRGRGRESLESDSDAESVRFTERESLIETERARRQDIVAGEEVARAIGEATTRRGWRGGPTEQQRGEGGDGCHPRGGREGGGAGEGRDEGERREKEE